MQRFLTAAVTAMLAMTAFAACGKSPADVSETGSAETDGAQSLRLSSPDFEEGGDIPARYSCEGQDISPTLEWASVPESTRAFALIMDDPDAPGGAFTHWVLYNLPAEATRLEEGVPAAEEMENGARHGQNSFGSAHYGGPCPPAGPSHRYQFTLYALDAPTGLAAGASKQRLLDAMQGHILARGTLTGRYQR